MAVPERVLSRVMSVPDFVLRLLYFWAVPLTVIVLAHSFPLGASILNVGFALGFFFAGQWLRERVPAGSPLGRFVAKRLGLERYYREHPPRPFLYYVFFPLLFPYWLLSRRARHEAGVFRRFALSSLLLLAALRAVDYLRAWYPIVPFNEFLGRAVGVLLVQLIVTFVLAMPLVVTVVGFHLERKRKRLLALAVVGALSVAAGVAIGRRLRFAVPVEVAARMEQKTIHRAADAQGAQGEALRAAEQLVSKPTAWAEQRLVEGAPLEVARRALAAFYREDEVACFHLVEVWPKGAPEGWLVLVGETGSKKRGPLYASLHLGEVRFGKEGLPQGVQHR